MKRGQKISVMPPSAPIQDTDWFHLVQGGANTRLVASAIRVYLDGQLNTILSGNYDPDNSEGIDGDFWINVITVTISGAKENGLWPSPVSIKGDKGDTGERGDDGLTGSTGATGDTGLTGQKGDAGANGQKGDDGSQGLQGATGAPGARGVPGKDGVGTPVGGLTGQVLAKISSLNYDFEWKTQGGGGDMLKTTYDPTFKEVSAFDALNHDYDNLLSGLVSNTTQGALDEVAISQAIGLAEYAAIADNAGGTIAEDVNAMDWTGHQHADGTALDVQSNHVITFGHGSNIAYRWVGDKPVKLGVGGDTLATDDDFFAIATGAHDVLINRHLVDSHPQSAVTDLVSDQGTQDARLGINEGDILALGIQIDDHEADLANPHQVTFGQAGAAPAVHPHLVADISDAGSMAYEDDALVDGVGRVRINASWAISTTLYSSVDGLSKMVTTDDSIDTVVPINYDAGVVINSDGDLVNRGYADNRYILRPTVSVEIADFTVAASDGFDHWYKIRTENITITIPAGLPVGHRFTIDGMITTLFDATGLVIDIADGKSPALRADRSVVGFIVTSDNVLTVFGDLG